MTTTDNTLTTTTTLLGVERGLRLTPAGNPRWVLITSHGRFPVRDDSSLVYDVENHGLDFATESWVGRRVVLTWEMGHEVSAWALADGVSA